MSAEKWHVRHARFDDLPIAAIVVGSDTGDTPIITINDAQPRRSILKAVRQLRSDLIAVMLMPQWQEVHEVLRRMITDCPVVIACVTALFGVGSAASLAAAPGPQAPAGIFTSAPDRQTPELERVAKPRGSEVPARRTPVTRSTNRPQEPAVAPTAAGGDAAHATNSPTPTATRHSEPTPTPSASTHVETPAPTIIPHPGEPLQEVKPQLPDLRTESD